MMVLDASVTIDLLLAIAPHAPRIEAHLRSESRGLAAPHLLDAEVGQVLRRLVFRKTINAGRAEEAIADLAALPIARFGHSPFLTRAFDFRDQLTVYDGLYLALAEAMGATLLTRDAAMAGIRHCSARVEVVS